MSRLDELITELCPNGVEFKCLSDVVKVARGIRVVKKQLSNEGAYPVYQNSGTPMGYYSESNCPADTTFIIGAGAAGEVGYSSVDFWAADDCFYFDCPETLSSRYLFHLLLNQQKNIYSKVRRASIPRLARNVVEEIMIPLPPLPVQEEIVRILDNFTKLSNELSNELSARKKQYEFYRSTLMTFGNDTPLTKLDDIANFSYGYTDTAKIQGTARFIRITDIGENGKLNPNNSMYVDLSSENEKYLLEKGDILMARTGATFGKTMIFQEDTPALYASFLIRIRFAENTVLPEYYWHFAQSNLYWSQANKLVSKAGQPQFNANVLRTVVIPVPPIQEQQRIVNLLNKFDVLNNDLISGLPAEIEARRKQYEYYRDKLLTFQEA